MSDPASTQPLRALKLANEVRVRRKVLRAKLREREVDALALLRGNVTEWEDVIVDMRLDTVLRSIPGIGEVTADDTIEVFRLKPQYRLSSLTYEVRGQIADMLSGVLRGEPVALPAPTPPAAA